MKNMLMMAPILLLSLLISAIPLQAQQICYESQETRVVTLKRLSHGSEISLDIAAGDAIYLSSDSGGTTLSGSGFSLGVKPSGETFHLDGTSDAADLSAMFVEGRNSVQFHAINEPDGHWWLTVHSPCPVASQQTAQVEAVPADAVAVDTSTEQVEDAQAQPIAVGAFMEKAGGQQADRSPEHDPSSSQQARRGSKPTFDPGQSIAKATPDPAAAPLASLDEMQARFKTATLTALTVAILVMQSFRILIVLAGLLILTAGGIFMGWKYRHTLTTTALKGWAAQARSSSRAIMERFGARISR